MDSEHFVAIHGHFYQPPRENPWLEAVEIQDSAAPYHDWNERITAECYEANGASHILDGEGNLVQVVNNYGRISFDFGPTLLAWLDRHHPEVVRAIRRGDRESRARYQGHGSALMQPYNHLIMPLATRRDKETQLIWGLADFRHHFGREPEGMWLPETAVDLETLVLARRLGIRFTILAPHQVARVGSSDGRPTPVDPAQPYRLALPDGEEMAVFVYDAETSQAVAFGRLLDSGDQLRARLKDGLGRGGPRLHHIATDGETYGHHHRFGDMALAWALAALDCDPTVRLTNYGEFLSLSPPVRDVTIRSHTSWSCIHGVERWQSDCGCDSGLHPDWQQAWRKPLRLAMDGLRDLVLDAYQDTMDGLGIDPWAIRNDYIQVILSRTPERWRWLLARHVGGELTARDQVRLAKLLEMARHAMLMYTSCGWFFDEISGLETVQVLQYAGRVLQLAGDLFGHSFDGAFLERLAEAPSNLEAFEHGADVYRKLVAPAVVDLARAATQFAIRDLFDLAEDTCQHGYTVARHHRELFAAGSIRAVVGEVSIGLATTQETARFGYGALHLGDHHLRAGVDRPIGPAAFGTLIDHLQAAFAAGDLDAVIAELEGVFSGLPSSLAAMAKDDQRAILEQTLRRGVEEAEAAYRQIYDHHALWISYLRHVGTPVPRPLAVAAELALGRSLAKALSLVPLDGDRIRALLAEAERVAPDAARSPEFGHLLGATLVRLGETLKEEPGDLRKVRRLTEGVRLSRAVPFAVDLRRLQTLVFEVNRLARDEVLGPPSPGDPMSGHWWEAFRELADELKVHPLGGI